MLCKHALSFILPAVLAAAVGGCGGGTAPSQQETKDSAAKTAGKAADDLPGLKELDEADRKLAEQQKYCPKTGELLGSMGVPHKITLKDRVVFLCCPGCEAEVRKDPDKYLKILDDKMAKK
jgi:hypothetical protein